MSPQRLGSSLPKTNSAKPATASNFVCDAKEKMKMNETSPILRGLLQTIDLRHGEEWAIRFSRIGITDSAFPLSAEAFERRRKSSGVKMSRLEFHQFLTMQESYFAPMVEKGAHLDYFSTTPYIIVKEAGFPARGSFGCIEKVTLTRDPSRVFARKEIYFNGPDDAPRIEKEISILRSFQHPHAVPFYGSFTYQKSTFLLMELCDTNLAGFLESPLPWFVDLPKTTGFNIIINWIIDLTSALQAFHALGAVHRDIKPQNILIKGQHIFLADFGLASKDPKLSQQAASVSGTERYKAPEMGTGETYTRKADIFSLGCVFLEILTLSNNLTLEFFSYFRQTWGKRDCHRSEHTCFRHNLEAVHFFVDKFFKKAPGVAYFVDEIKQMISESPKFRPSSHDVFVRLLRGAKQIQGFKKSDCCAGDVRKVRYADASIESISMRLAELSIRDTMLLGSSEWSEIMANARIPLKSALY